MGSVICSYCCFLFKNYISKIAHIKRKRGGGGLNPNSMFFFFFFPGGILKGSSIYMIQKSSL